MAETAQPAIAAAGAIVKARLQAGIFAAGLGSGFVKALRVEFYPKRNNSTDATAPAHHKIPDASVFEEGATIRGRPRTWIALLSAPQRLGRKPMTPKLFRQPIGPLDFVNRADKKPLLFAKVKAGRNTAKMACPVSAPVAAVRGHSPQFRSWLAPTVFQSTGS